ncbi:MAG: fimbrillin family protein [Muribaculaceae bacterium]|nr:fimbrillin family protein [Muribaculaceae bacterium]
MKKFFYVAIAATALASCSSDQLVDLKEGDEIKITAVADNDSRADSIFCNNNLMPEFNLYAAVGKKTFIDGEVYAKTGVAYSTTAKRYWPENDAVDFYALHNQGTFNWVPAATVPNPVASGSFAPATSVAAQKDFVYAVKKEVVKPADGVVALNFRHALSQIEFQAKNQNTDLKIEILDVKVGNALSTATYTLPETTDGNIVNHDLNATPESGSYPAQVITWSSWAAGGSNISYTFGAEFDAKTLTDTEKTLTLGTPETDYAKSMLLLPQSTTAWAADATTGTYLAVKVRIWNVSGTDETLIYGDADPLTDGYEGRWAFVPVAFNWEPGKKYVYTFNFTNGGNAGYEDTDNNGEPDNKPVLVPLTVNVTVDDFVEAAGQPVDTPMVK